MHRYDFVTRFPSEGSRADIERGIELERRYLESIGVDPGLRPKKRKRKTMAKAKRKKAHCKRVKVKKGSRKTRLMCWGANGKIVSAKRSKAAKKARRKR